MKQKSESWLTWLYQSNYATHKLPTNLCTLFWSYLFMFLLFPFCYPIHIINTFDKSSGMGGGFGVLVHALVGAFGVLGLKIIDWIRPYMLEQFITTNWYSYFAIILCGVLLIGAILCIIIIIVELIIPRLKRMFPKPKIKEDEIEKKYIVWEFVKAKKRKICPIIEWK